MTSHRAPSSPDTPVESELDRLTRELARSEARFRALIEGAQDIVTLLEADGTIRYESPSVERELGWRPEELVGRKVFDLIHPEDLPVVANAFGRALENPGVPLAVEFRFRHRDGSWNVLEAVGTNLLHDPAVQAIVANSRDVTDRREIDALLRESESRFRRLVEQAADAILVHDVEGRIVHLNEAACRMYGYSRSALLATRLHQLTVGIDPERHTRILRDYVRQIQEDGPLTVVGRNRRRDGSTLPVEARIGLFDADPGRPLLLAIIRDVTERTRLEEQLRQAQKIEAVGRLAGGIAHDFNNLLTAIRANVDFLLTDLPADDPLREDAEEIRRASERAASLTRQLLAFSRKQVLQPTTLDLNVLVAETEKMLRRLLGEDIEFITRLDHSPGRVKIDPGQMEQVILNLALNARDAMPGGGTLTLETRRAEVDAEEARECGEGMRPGGYVVLTVSDTGRGMDPGVLERIFEPFFTTKEEGSGLGLATVHGIVRQSGGHLVVRSEVGRGTTFRVYLPREEGDGEEAPLPARWTAPGRGTVLLVEDEDAVRDAVRRVLERSGYTVLVMDNGEEALRLFQQCADAIDVLVTDVVMPRMNGRELSERVTALRPEIRVLFMSGYTDDVISQHGVLAPGTEFIQKPFSPEALARRVGELIARGP